MKYPTDIAQLLMHFQSYGSEKITIDEEHVVAAYAKNSDTQSLPIKVVSVLGGIFASLSFAAFLVVTGIYKSGYALLTLGVLCIVTAVWISRHHRKVILETISVSIFAIGFVLLGTGLNLLKIHEQHVYLIFIALSLCTIIYVGGYVLIFMNVVLTNGSILALILSGNADLIHIQTSLLAIILCYYLLQEARIIRAAKTMAIIYSPVRAGLMFSFVGGLLVLGKRGLIDTTLDYLWITSLIHISVILFVAAKLLLQSAITNRLHQLIVYALIILTLLPTVFSPAISGAILLVVLSFFVNYKTGFVVGILSLVYFVAQYYYDLEFSLLIKSIILLLSGFFFLALYFIINKRTSNA